MFENRVLRIIFGPKRDEVTREWRKVHTEEINDLYTSPNIGRVIKSRRMIWPGLVVHMGERRGFTGFWWENLEERDHLGDPGVDGRIILRWILWKWDGGYGLDRAGLGQGRVEGTCECGNEPSCSIKCEEFLD
jgi:hypothetical protein